MRTLLCAIARMENAYIREWVEYYKNLGFTNICLYDNNYDGEQHFEDVIGDYIDGGFVILKNYRNRSVCQLDAYTECYSEYGNQYDWIAFFDCDEFLTLKEHKNISQYLSEEVFNDFFVIRINWMMFGDNDMLYNDERRVLDRFTTPLPKNNRTHGNCCDNFQVKSILRGNQTIKVNEKDGFIFVSPHMTNLYPICDNAGHHLPDLFFSYTPNYEWACLKHFCTKTASEYCDKIERGYPDGNYKDLESRINDLIENVFFVTNKVTPAKIKIFKDRFGKDFSYLLK